MRYGPLSHSRRRLRLNVLELEQHAAVRVAAMTSGRRGSKSPPTAPTSARAGPMVRRSVVAQTSARCRADGRVSCWETTTSANWVMALRSGVPEVALSDRHGCAIVGPKKYAASATTAGSARRSVRQEEGALRRRALVIEQTVQDSNKAPRRSPIVRTNAEDPLPFSVGTAAARFGSWPPIRPPE